MHLPLLPNYTTYYNSQLTLASFPGLHTLPIVQFLIATLLTSVGLAHAHHNKSCHVSTLVLGGALAYQITLSPFLVRKIPRQLTYQITLPTDHFSVYKETLW